MSRLMRAATGTAAASAVFAIGLMAAPAANAEATSQCPRQADNGSYCLGTVAAGAGLNVRLDTNGAAGPIATGQIIATIPYGSTVYIRAWWNSSTETGPWGSTAVWDAIDYYQTPDGVMHDLRGEPGDSFVSDAWVNDGGNTQDFVIAAYGCC